MVIQASLQSSRKWSRQWLDKGPYSWEEIDGWGTCLQRWLHWTGFPVCTPLRRSNSASRESLWTSSRWWFLMSCLCNWNSYRAPVLPLTLMCMPSARILVQTVLIFQYRLNPGSGFVAAGNGCVSKASRKKLKLWRFYSIWQQWALNTEKVFLKER